MISKQLILLFFAISISFIYSTRNDKTWRILGLLCTMSGFTIVYVDYLAGQILPTYLLVIIVGSFNISLASGLFISYLNRKKNLRRQQMFDKSD